MTKRVKAGVIAAIMLCTFPAHADWHGYVNAKSSADSKYGYLITHSTNKTSSKVRLLCLSGDQFRILIDGKIVGSKAGSTVAISIDSLPAQKFRLQRFGDDFAIDHRAPGFWKLLAQKVAGANTVVTGGAGTPHRYSLSGFTAEFENACGWLDSANRYQEFVELYR